MSAVDRLVNQILDCPFGSEYITEEYSAVRRWHELKQHALKCPTCHDALLEYEHLSGATVLLPRPVGQLL